MAQIAVEKIVEHGGYRPAAGFTRLVVRRVPSARRGLPIYASQRHIGYLLVAVSGDLDGIVCVVRGATCVKRRGSTTVATIRP